jgi:hypothetical protein
MKKLLLLSLCISSAICVAETLLEKEAKLEHDRLEYLKSQGIPYLGDGVHVIKTKKLFNKDEYNEFEKKYASIKKQGFVEGNSPIITDLKNLETETEIALSSKPDDADEHYTGWQRNLNDLKLSWKFKPLNVGNTLAYAPISTYENGWNGVTVAFQVNKHNCKYDEASLQKGHISHNLPSEHVTDDVNKKLTMLYAEGNKNDGYFYGITWFDPDFSHELICYTDVISQEKLNFFIEKAKEIDKR